MNQLIPLERVESKILVIRDQKVMLDRDLAELYGIETKQLKRQVSRNLDRFPVDFMFVLTAEEFENLRCQFGTSSWGGIRYSPIAFTEQGVAMLSSVLRSKRAVQVNILIMRAFVKMREMLQSHAELKRKIEAMERKYDGQFRVVFEAIKQLMEPLPAPKKVYGFRAAKSGNGGTKTKGRKRT
ncbi:MAG: ORF6N domain-containing protein [bacterium]|nr:ORF6N domain-containing protein [bacterium]